jgi:hypothetical protein
VVKEAGLSRHHEWLADTAACPGACMRHQGGRVGRRLGSWLILAVLAAGCATPSVGHQPTVNDPTDVWFAQHMVPTCSRTLHRLPHPHAAHGPGVGPARQPHPPARPGPGDPAPGVASPARARPPRSQPPVGRPPAPQRPGPALSPQGGCARPSLRQGHDGTGSRRRQARRHRGSRRQRACDPPTRPTVAGRPAGQDGHAADLAASLVEAAP